MSQVKYFNAAVISILIGAVAVRGQTCAQVKDGVAIFPNGTRSIAAEAFRDCPELRSVTIPNTVLTTGDRAFRNSGIEIVTFEADSQVDSIGNEAFADTNIQTIVMPASLRSIGDDAFFNSGLLTVTFEAISQVDSIGERAFAKTNILTIVIPASVRSIGSAAFADSSIRNIFILSTVIQLGENLFTNTCMRDEDPELGVVICDCERSNILSCPALLDIITGTITRALQQTTPAPTSTLAPNTSPSSTPTSAPTTSPPTSRPTTSPTTRPPTTSPPTLRPTANPTARPTTSPLVLTNSPTPEPDLTALPTALSTRGQTLEPTPGPTSDPQLFGLEKLECVDATDEFTVNDPPTSTSCEKIHLLGRTEKEKICAVLGGPIVKNSDRSKKLVQEICPQACKNIKCTCADRITTFLSEFVDPNQNGKKIETCESLYELRDWKNRNTVCKSSTTSPPYNKIKKICPTACGFRKDCFCRDRTEPISKFFSTDIMQKPRYCKDLYDYSVEDKIILCDEIKEPVFSRSCPVICSNSYCREEFSFDSKDTLSFDNGQTISSCFLISQGNTEFKESLCCKKQEDKFCVIGSVLCPGACKSFNC